MKLEQQVCSLPLAQRLKELGVKQESYFRWVGDSVWSEDQLSEYETFRTPKERYSAFTVAELGEMLPRYTFTRRTHKLVPERWICINDAGLPEKEAFANTEADARAKMLIYLLENKLITL